MCTTTSHWATHISGECSLGGTAQCDGYCVDHDKECTCSCHGEWDLPQTVSEVRDWHDKAESVVASFDVAYPYSDNQYGLAWGAAVEWIDAMVASEKQYKVRGGQNRIVVVEDYS